MKRSLIPLLMLFIGSACTGSGGDDPGALLASETAGTTFVGADVGDHLAASVTGDFDGDGRLDIALAATGGDGPDDARSDSGEVYVLFDLAAQEPEVDLSENDPEDIVIYGPYPGAALGRALSVGDYNGDGVDDLAAGAPLGVDPDTGVNSSGRVYMLFGSSKGLTGKIDLAQGAAEVEIVGEDAGDGAGLSLESADFDGDGTDDLLIGAHLADGPGNERAEAGEAYIVSGAPRPRMSLPGDAAAVVIGANDGDHLSETISSGDFTGDGASEAVIAATFSDVGGEADSGLTYVLPSPMVGTIDMAITPAAISIGGADAGDQMGHSIGVGDRDGDGDGTTDLWLGSVSADGPGNTEDLAGEAHLFVIDPNAFLIDPPPPYLDTDDSAALVIGPGPKARLGRSAAMGQFDGEGGPDLAIAATDVLDRRGEVYVLFGGETPERANSASLIFRGENADDILGHESFGSPPMNATDIDGDGLNEILIAAPGSDGLDRKRVDCGAVYLIRPAGITE
jgi:hypothetical protein